jgi:hypothetical protein
MLSAVSNLIELREQGLSDHSPIEVGFAPDLQKLRSSKSVLYGPDGLIDQYPTSLWIPSEASGRLRCDTYCLTDINFP